MGLTEGLIEFLTPRTAPRPLWYRILTSAYLAAALGAVISLLGVDLPVFWLGLAAGLLFALFTLQFKRILLGTLTGMVFGALALFFFPEIPPAFFLAALVLLFRVLGWVLFNAEQPVTLVGERLSREDAEFVVPYQARGRYVGADFMQELAKIQHAGFARNPKGIGIVASLDLLNGPQFHAQEVDAGIRDFYEHTSRYKLHIVPEWKRRYQWAYALFKRLVAQCIGQANLPVNTTEAQRGIVSYIDTLDFEGTGEVTLRGWVRAFEDTGEAIYVGIYTTLRQGDVGYVSVGFPLPEGNFTATLLPSNAPDGGLYLRSDAAGFDFPGHYLSEIDRVTGRLTTVKMPFFGEDIHVFVEGGELRTDHRFFVNGLNFLTLHYMIEPLNAD